MFSGKEKCYNSHWYPRLGLLYLTKIHSCSLGNKNNPTYRVWFWESSKKLGL